MRYNSDGTRDLSFGSAGQVLLSVLINSLTLQSDGKILVTGDQRLCVWDPSTRQRLRVLAGNKTELLCLVLLPDGETIVTGDNAGRVYREAMIWPALVQQQLLGKIGTDEIVYGRVTQGLKLKPNQSPPWVIGEPDDGHRPARGR